MRKRRFTTLHSLTCGDDSISICNWNPLEVWLHNSGVTWTMSKEGSYAKKTLCVTERAGEPAVLLLGSTARPAHRPGCAVPVYLTLKSVQSTFNVSSHVHLRCWDPQRIVSLSATSGRLMLNRKRSHLWRERLLTPGVQDCLQAVQTADQHFEIDILFHLLPSFPPWIPPRPPEHIRLGTDKAANAHHLKIGRKQL